jgi:hypothetical protein
MKIPAHSKSRNGARLVRIDETTWIETVADVPDNVARDKFMEKIARRSAGTIGQPVRNVAVG